VRISLNSEREEINHKGTKIREERERISREKTREKDIVAGPLLRLGLMKGQM
jgi:hypothetical protein